MTLTASPVPTSGPSSGPSLPPSSGSAGGSAIDRHVATVRAKLATTLFLRGAGVGLACVGGGAALSVLAARLAQWHVPGGYYTLGGAAGAALIGAGIYAVSRRPTPLDAAMAIDNALGLHERLSTALVMRNQRNLDEFGRATLADANRVAATIQPGPHFKVRWPRSLAVAAIVAAVAGACTLLPERDLLGRKAAAVAEKKQAERQEQAKREIKAALATIEKTGSVVAGDATVERAKKELESMLERPIADTGAASRSALSALQDLQKAISQKIENNQKYAAAEQERRALAKLMPGPDEKGAVADAAKAIASGDFNEAIKSMEKVVNDFDNLSQDEQKKQADQLKALAQQMQEMAQTKGNEKKMAEQLQKAMQQQGIPPQQAQQLAQQMAQQMQQAATGNQQQKQQAMQQMQQMAQQAMQQLNGGQGPSPAQMQQLQQMMQQMQQQAGQQANAQQLAQAMQQMAQAMQKQAGQQGQQQQGQQQQQNQQGQQAGNQQQQQQGGQQNQQGAQSQQANAGQQASQQNQGGQQASQGQQGQQSQQNGQAGQSANAGMEQSLQDMKDALGAMQAIQNDASALDAAANAAQQAAQAQAGNCNGQGQGEWGEGNKPFNGQEGLGRGGGQGAGDRTYKEQAPYQVKQERAPTQNNENGRILASTLVKAGAVKGESKEQLKEIAKAAEQEAAEEVDTERISKSAQGAVREYFNSLRGETPAKPGPTTRP